MRGVTKAFLWSLVVVLTLLSGSTVFLMTAGDSFYRWALRQAIEGRIERNITVDGSFSFEMGLEPSLTVTDARMANAPWADERDMARARRIEVQVALLPLFSGVIRIPRLVIDGLTLDLERSSEGEANWTLSRDTGAQRKPDKADSDSLSYPIAEVFSLTDIAITFQDRRSGRQDQLLLERLTKEPREGDDEIDVSGAGSLNGRSFEITGRYGSIEQALTATSPYPFDLTLRSSNTVSELKGTVANLPAASGIDARLTVRAEALDQVMEHLRIDLPLSGRAEASAHLTGDLAALAAEEIKLELVDAAGQALEVAGRVDNLSRGEGLDLEIGGALGPDVLDRLPLLQPREGSPQESGSRLDVVGRVTGSLGAPEVANLQAHLEHASGARLTLQGDGRLDLADDGIDAATFEADVLLFLPDKALLERALDQPLPDLGALRANADLAWLEERIVLRAGEVETDALAKWEIKAEGPLATFSPTDFGLAFEPQVRLSTNISEPRQLIPLLEELLAAEATAGDMQPEATAAEPELPSLTGADLTFAVQQRLKEAGYDPGPVDGKVGPKTRTAIEQYQSSKGLPIDGLVSRELLRSLVGQLVASDSSETTKSQPPSRETSVWAEALPDFGPLAASVTFTGNAKDYRFDELELRLGQSSGPRIEASGTLGRFEPEGEIPLQDIALAVSFAAPSSAGFSALLPPELPALSNIAGRFTIQGDLERLALSNAQVSAAGPNGLQASARGEVATLMVSDGLQAQGIALDLEANWPDTKAVARLAEIELPELGPVQARARLIDRGSRFGLTGIDVAAGGTAQPAARITGQIGNLASITDINIAGTFDLPTEAVLAFVQGLPEDTEVESTQLGEIHGEFELSDRDGSLGLEALSAETEDTQLLSLSLKGLFDDIRERDEIWMEAALIVPDVSQVRRELGLDPGSIRDLAFNGKIAGKDEQLQAEGKIRIGESELFGTLSGTLKEEHPIFTASLTSPRTRLSDLGLTPLADAVEKGREAESAATTPQGGNAITGEARDNVAVPAPAPAPAPAPREAASVERIFGEDDIGFEALRGFDLVLDILLEDIEGIHLELDKIEAKVDVADGRLTASPLTFNFVGGYVDASLDIDAAGETPQLQLRFSADDVQLGDFLAQSRVDVPLEGDLDLLVELDGAGDTPHAIASSLSGKFDAAVERGRLETSLLRLAATDVLSWMISSDARRGYAEINCMIMRFDVQDGVAQSTALVLDTPRVQALGTGNIDLGRETIDIEVSPQAKSRSVASLTTPFAIRGPLADPDVAVSTSGAVAREVGNIILKPINILGSLLPLVSDRGDDKDNPCLALEQGLERE